MHSVVIVQKVKERELGAALRRLFIQFRIAIHTIVGFVNLLVHLLQAGIGIHDNLVATEQPERLIESLYYGLFRPCNAGRGGDVQNVMNRFLCGDKRQVIIGKTRTPFEGSRADNGHACG